MKENYKAWDINLDDFYKITDEKEKLKFLLKFAVLAPSAHNSQPWEFSVSDNAISIFANKERSLKQGDPLGRLLLMGIGCAVENILVAADYFGFETMLDYFQGKVIAKISFKNKNNGKRDKNHLVFQIQKRHTNRGPYTMGELPQSFKDVLGDAIDGNNNALVVFDKNTREKIADLIIESNTESMESSVFREELSHYIKSNVTNSKVGMPGFTIGLHGLISMIAPFLIKKTNITKKNKKIDEKLLKEQTPAFLVISTKEDSKQSWLESGIFLQHVWLLTGSFGLSFSPFASVTQMFAFRERLKNMLRIQDYPQIILRVGYGEKNFKHSPRFQVKDILFD